MLSDIVIAQNAKVLPIKQIADKLSIDEEYLEYYGKDKAKIDLSIPLYTNTIFQRTTTHII